MTIRSAVDYPEVGITVLEDEKGKFLAFKDHDTLVDLEAEENFTMFPKKWKGEADKVRLYEED